MAPPTSAEELWGLYRLPQGSPRTYVASRMGDDPKPEVLAAARAAAPGGPPWWAVALPVALVTGAVTYLGSGRQMWIDEYVTTYVSRLSRHDLLHLLRDQDLVHSLYYLLIRLWTAIFGYSVFDFRLPSMIGMAVAGASIAVLGRRLHSGWAGLGAGLMFAALPSVSRYGQEARSYAWVVALTCLTTIVLTFALARPSILRWSGYGLLALGLTYLHFAAAMVLLPHAVLALAASRKSREGQFRGWAVTATIVAVMAAPFLYEASKQSGQVDWIKSDGAAIQRYPVELFGSQVVASILVILGLLGAMRLARTRPGVSVALLVWALVPPFVSYFTVGFAHLFLAKYALFTLPAWTLLAAATFTPAKGTRRWFAALQVVTALAAVAVLAAAGLPGQRIVRESPLAGEPDFHSAAAVVDTGYQSGDGIVYAGTYRIARIPFGYELHRATPTDVYVAVTPQQNGWFYPQDCADPVKCLGTTPRVWLVVTNFSDDDYYGLPSGEADALKQGYAATSKTKFTNIRVVLLVRKPA